MKSISRRKFMGQAGCAAMTSTTMLSTLLNLKALGAAAMSDSDVIGANDYKALVCISLAGGSDGFNMLVPTLQSEYDDYATARSNLAITRSNLLGLNSLNTPGRTFGVHPSMPNIRGLFDQGKASFVANVGTLVEPLTVQQFWDDTKQAPLGLLSHSDQLQQWMTALPHERAGIGWGGKVADMINQMNNTSGLSMNISMAGTNIFQTGVENVEYSMNPVAFLDGQGNPQSAITEIEGYNDDWLYNTLKKNAIDEMLNRTYSDIYESTYANTNKRARDGIIAIKDALDNVTLSTEFNVVNAEDGEELTHGLGWVAKMIAARDTLGFKRQTFFVQYGGFDHHDELVDSHTAKLSELDYAVNQFQLAMQELGTEDCVVTFLISDFARTLRSNGNGTDHAWGSNMMVIGGNSPSVAGPPVIPAGPLYSKGQRIYGSYPATLDPDQSTIDVGGGILLPTTSADVYFAQLAEWFGVSKSNLGTIFPNLGNFYDYLNVANPLGFLNV